MKGFDKYQKSYFMPPEESYDWVKKDSIDKAPVWCSVDLRESGVDRAYELRGKSRIF